MPEVSAAGRARPLWALNGTILLASFVCSGLATVIPQLRVLELVPDQKAYWLALCLLLGTLGAIIGTLAGGAFWERKLSPRWILAPLAGTALGGWALFVTPDPRLFAACYVGACALANLLITRFDHLACRLAGEARRAFNDRLSTACRLLGMLIAPWFFTHMLQSRLAVTGVAVLCTVCALAGYAAALRIPRGPIQAGRSSLPLASGRLGWGDYLVLGHAVTVYASLYLFAANLSYFLRDGLALEQAGARAGLLIVMVFLAAFAVVASGSRLPVHAPDGRPGLVALAPTVPLILALGLYEGRSLVTYPTMLGLAATLGAGYGLFLLVLRDHVSRSAREGKAVMLTVYNNLANLSALLAFAGMLLLARLEPGSSEAYYHAWMRLLAGVSLAGVPFLWFAWRRFTRVSLVRGESHP